jgi:signal transduction histidine kinase
MGRPPATQSRSEAPHVLAEGPRSARQAILDDVRARLNYLAAELEDPGPGEGDPESIVRRLRSLATALEVLNRSAEDEREHLAHALRTPLNAIAGWIGVLRQHADDPSTVHQAAAVLDRSVSTLARIVDASTR